MSEGSFHFLQPVPDRGGSSLYRGKTVMLIDERAIRQSEHTGLFFEAANGTTFVGSPTMGANGDVTTLTLPGDIVISFSGHDVRHADGRQLQRVGLVPHIEVRPTIKGIREGQDEVLERARKFLLETDAEAGKKKAV
jgi:C-terminal processing protease CtpA/Prc